MKKALAIYVMSWAAVFCSAVQTTAAESPRKDSLDVLEMKAVPEGTYDVQLQLAGRNHTVTLEVKNNQAEFVKATGNKLDGLRGEFELIGNGVFVAMLAGDNHRATQFWIFHTNGTATVKEMPDRGEKQTAKPTKGK